MALIKCSECKKEISSTAKVCPHCGFKNDKMICTECGCEVKQSDSACPECGYPLQKKNPQSIINENLDKITGAKSENYVTFKDLFKHTFDKHTDEELDEVFICGGEKTTPDVKDIDPRKANAWVYFKILMFFLIAYIPVRIGFISYGNANFLPAMIMLAALLFQLRYLYSFMKLIYLEIFHSIKL